MERFILLVSLLMFLACLGLHIVIWRWWCPRRRVVMLALIFLGLPALFAVVGLCLLRLGLITITPAGLSQWKAVYLLHFSLSAAYIATYPGVEVDSPSLAMLLLIGAAGPRGLSHEELKQCFDVNTLLLPRVQDLFDGGLAVETDGRLQLTSRGSFVIRFFILFRRLLGLPAGKG